MKTYDPCLVCGTAMVSGQTHPVPEGMRRYGGRGMCNACLNNELRGAEHRALNPGGIKPLFDPLPWTDQALCAQTEPEAFFPEKGGSTREAKAVCRSCTVRAECLDYALTNLERYGIWGGLSERERRKLTKGQAA